MAPIAIVVLFLLAPDCLADVTISHASYEDRDQLKVETDGVTYFYDVAGGGFSRLIDSDGNDWIGFHRSPLSSFPASAAAGYRGLPNLVFAGKPDEAGAGHPGFDQCTSEVIGGDSILTTSRSGQWSWLWTFTDEHATCEIVKADPSRAYWFLYEGPVGGKWSPRTHFFGTNVSGPHRDLHDNSSQLFGHWQWAYFGDDSSRNVLLLTQLQADDAEDTLWYLGNSEQGIDASDGMVVFGFGRGPKATPLLRGPGHRFRIALVSCDSPDHERLSVSAGKLIAGQPINESGANAATHDRETQHSRPERWRGPQPPQGKPWPVAGHWFERTWFQMGDAFANPPVNNRFRVNDPYVATHPEFHSRSEPKGNGMMLVPIRQSPRSIDAARLYLELWGGHPYTTNRRVTVNGRSTYPIPIPIKTQCTHAYHQIPILITDLVLGNNALQFNVDGDETFWGHFIIEEAGIDLLLPKDSDELSELRSAVAVPPVVEVGRLDGSDAHAEVISLSLSVDEASQSAIARVDYVAMYDGFDENGDGVTLDWHGMTKRKEPLAHLGSATEPPYAIHWDTSMIPAQENIRVRAAVHWRNDPETTATEEVLRGEGSRYWKSRSLIYQTAPTAPLTIGHPDGITVVRIPATKMSEPFWSRADKEKSCVFDVEVDPANIVRAVFQSVVWDGGAGEVTDYFTLAGHPLKIAGAGGHDVIVSTVEIEPSWLTAGENRCALRSDTLHHGIEMLYPGPSLTLRLHVLPDESSRP